MKTSKLLILAGLFLTSALMADQTVSFPGDKPVIDISFPSGWELKPKSGSLYAHPEGDSGYFMSLSELEATSADPTAAVEEVKEGIAELFKNVKYQEPQTTEAGDLDIMLLNAKGEDDDGVANINVWMIAKKGEETLLVLKCVSSQAAFEKYAEIGGEIINSITSHDAGGSATNSGAAKQTYAYPDKENPTFVMDVPADWTIEADDKGAFVSAADKKFTATIIAIDMEHIMEATDSIGKDVTARYQSVNWNEGGKPTTKIDEATGMTVTSNEGIGVGKDGSTHKLGLFQFAKKGSDKFYVVTTWAPENAVADNAEGILMMLSSINHK